MPFEMVNSKCVKATVPVGGAVIARRGAMLFYTGPVQFSPHSGGGPGGQGGPGGVLGMAGRAMQGEHVAMMAAHGSGEVWFGRAGLHVTLVDMVAGGTISVEADRLLAHDHSLQSSVVFLGSQGGVRGAVRGAMTGQGLFTTQLSGSGWVALLSHGGTIELPVRPDRPTVVDPQAYVAHTGQVTVDVSASVGWRDAVGKGSGEAVQLRLTGQGSVYVQASEQKL